MLSGCYGTKYLKDDEKLLYKQKIKGNDHVTRDELAEFYQQKPNRHIIGIWAMYLWLHETGKKSYNPEKYRQKIEKINLKYNEKYRKVEGNAKKESRVERKRDKKIRKVEKTIREGNLLMRWGEPIALLDTQKISKTTSQIHLYLISKGYFRSATSYDIAYNNQKARVSYVIHEDAPYIIDSLVLKAENPTLNALINAFEDQSLLKKGDRYDQNILSDENSRIETLLKDNGYFDFNKRYINFDIDTTIGNHKIAIRTVISDPGEGKEHRIFKIDSIIFTTDANVKNISEKRDHFNYNGITYKYYKDIYSLRVLDRRIFLRPGNLYSKSNTFETQRQLTNMNVFRFVNVNYDTTGGRFVANIFSSPRKRQQFTSELGFTLTYGYPGPFLDLGYVVRNVFHGLENLQFNIRGGIEGVPSATDFTKVLATTEAGFNVSLTFPQFLMPGGQVINNKFGRFNPKTRISGGFNLNDRPEYNRKGLVTSIDYSWSKDQKRNYTFYLADVKFINTDFKDSTFLARLEELQQEGNNLINSFLPSFVSSTSFAAAYNFGEYGVKNNTGSFLRFSLESGGTLLNLFGTDFLTNRNLEHYKYLRADIDFRKRTTLSSSTVIAYRLTLGGTYAYSKERVLPYEKYFFSGGATSIRAWRPRRLGPGSYTPADRDGNVSYNIEQPGEILFEAGVEIRQDISKILEGALFVDAGNIWVIRDSDTRKALGGGLEDFYSEIAVGAGAGIRFDFTFFLFRLDAAFKIYDPARQMGNRFILSDGFFDDPVNAAQRNEFPLINFAIGYPF